LKNRPLAGFFIPAPRRDCWIVAMRQSSILKAMRRVIVWSLRVAAKLLRCSLVISLDFDRCCCQRMVS
jgi:hypothetical protein